MNPLAPLPVVVPLLAAALLVASSPVFKRWFSDTVAFLTAVVVLVLCLILAWQSREQTIVYWFGGWAPRMHEGREAAIGIGFVIDPLGAGLASLCALLMASALLFSWRYFAAVKTLYHALMLIFLAAMSGFCLTGDLFNLFVYFELMSVAGYALTGYKVEEESALEGAINFAVTNSIAGFMVLFGIGLLYGRTGALNMAQVGAALAAQTHADGLVIMALVLIFSGFFTKAAVIPLHFWLADAHAVAPTPVCVLFSGVMVEQGLYGAARIYWTIFHGAMAQHEAALRTVLLAAGTLTALAGGVLCLSQRHIKRLLASSTISHMGMMLLGFALLSPSGVAGVALYILGHGLVKGALFMGAGILLHRFSSVDEHDLYRRARRLIPAMIVFVVGGLALAGLPPFATALGKVQLEAAGEQIGCGWITAVLIAASVLTGAAVLRVAGHVFWGLGHRESLDQNEAPTESERRETTEEVQRTPWVMSATALTLLALGLAAGLWPGLREAAGRAAARFVDQPAYIDVVLRGGAVSRMPVAKESGSTMAELLYGLGSAAGAAALAALFLYHRLISAAWFQRLKELLKRASCRLNNLHSGNVADYVAWMVAALAGFAAGLLLLIKNG